MDTYSSFCYSGSCRVTQRWFTRTPALSGRKRGTLLKKVCAPAQRRKPRPKEALRISPSHTASRHRQSIMCGRSWSPKDSWRGSRKAGEGSVGQPGIDIDPSSAAGSSWRVLLRSARPDRMFSNIHLCCCPRRKATTGSVQPQVGDDVSSAVVWFIEWKRTDFGGF